MIIRVLGLIVGLCAVLIFGLMLYKGNEGFISSISGLVTGILFVVYGVFGSAPISKIFPSLVGKRK